MFRLKFWGVRGSIPTPGPDTAGIGGNTSCLEVQADDTLIILDGGTGLRGLGNALMKRGGPISAYMFFSHVHWDHIQGFPFFTPLFVPESNLYVFGGENLEMNLGDTLAGQMNFPNFPVSLNTCAAKIHYRVFTDGERISLRDQLTVTGLPLQHPNGCYGYRIQYQDRVIAYCTDTEHGGDPAQMDANVLSLAANADVFVYDAQYTTDEYTGAAGGLPRIGWGHSTYTEAARLARQADVKELVLFHHDPSHDDDTIKTIEANCQKLFPRTVAAVEGMEFVF